MKNPSPTGVDFRYVALCLNEAGEIVARQPLQHYPSQRTIHDILSLNAHLGAVELDIDKRYFLTETAAIATPAYVFARFPGSHKEYCWHNPCAIPVQQGDTVLVQTIHGPQQLTVCRTAAEKPTGHAPTKSIVSVVYTEAA